MPELRTGSGILYGYFSDTRFAPALGRPVSRLIQLLPGQGCVPWLQTRGECCVFCRLPAGTREVVLGKGHEGHFDRWSVSSDDYVEMIDTAMAGDESVETVTVFNGGSFLTDREIPPEARSHLYRRFAAHHCAQELMVETRPEFVRERTLDEAEDLIGGKTLMLAIGLESFDDHVRNEILKKYIGRQSFLSAIERLQCRGFRSFVYTFLGAPGLSERAAYDDVVRTMDALTGLGIDEIALSCAFVPPGGHLERMYRAETFRPPWLWTIVRLIADAQAQDWPMSVGGFDDFPPPVAIAQNCGRCDGPVLEAIQDFRLTGRMSFDRLPDCACREDWQHLVGLHL